jgi:hypothetical protein
MEDEGDNVQLAPETTANVGRKLNETRSDTSTNKLHEMFCKKEINVSVMIIAQCRLVQNWEQSKDPVVAKSGDRERARTFGEICDGLDDKVCDFFGIWFTVGEMEVLDGEIDRVGGIVDAQTDFNERLVRREISSNTKIHGLCEMHDQPSARCHRRR